MKRSTTIFLLLILSSCISDKCGEPRDERLGTISFLIVEGTQYVFNNDDARKSLQVISLERNKPVDFSFVSSGLFINDSAYDLLAEDALICPSYILKYRTDDVDTLKVCYKRKTDKCDGSQFEDVRVFWNQELMDYSGSDLRATITK
jgi:hypothetical protein